MARPLIVWRWLDFRPGIGQTEETVAARSMAEVARLAGEKYPRNLFNLGETGNAGQIAAAMSEPGVIFWRPLDDRGPWRKSELVPVSETQSSR